MIVHVNKVKTRVVKLLRWHARLVMSPFMVVTLFLLLSGTLLLFNIQTHQHLAQAPIVHRQVLQVRRFSDGEGSVQSESNATFRWAPISRSHNSDSSDEFESSPEWDVEDATCEPNANLTELRWFKALPEHFKHFVAHRHCRYFPMLHNHPKKCGAVDGSKYVPYLLLVMKSTPAQAERREAIRRTWGREGLASGGRKIKRLFLLALPPDTPEGALQQKLVDYEDRVHGDILQWAFTDSFFNLTLKELNFLKWFHMFCPRVPFVFKGDDDVFVNTANVIDYLALVRPGSDLFAGDVIEDAMPIRNPESKYYIPPPIFRPVRYPPYAGGGGYLMSGVLTRRLHAAAKLVDNFPIDDVWLGMVLRRLNVIPLHHPGFRTFGIVRRRETPMNKDPCFYRGLLLVHKLMPPELLAMWETIHNPALRCYKSRLQV